MCENTFSYSILLGVIIMAVVLVLSVSRWKFADEQTGEQREGVSIQYIQEPSSPKQDSRGSSPMKISAPLDSYQVFDKVPAFYDVTFDVLPGPGGKPKVVYDGATYVRPLQMDFSKAGTKVNG